SLVWISSAAIVYVPDNYSSIQEAINAVSVDDTVIVHKGTYNENVVLNKSLSLIGEGYPSVDAQQKGSAIRITADGCVVKGFRCVNAKYLPNAGISVESCSNVIANNTCTKNNCAIILDGNSSGGSSSNTIENNTCFENCQDGIFLFRSSDSRIINNTCRKNYDIGITLWYSSNDTIANNTFESCYDGIQLSYSSNNIIMNNEIHENYENGIHLRWDSSNNYIYLNEFVNNSLNTNSNRSDNIWNSPLKLICVYNGKEYEGYMGNYWDDYKGKDEDGDGIGDTSYRINEPWDTGVEDDSDDYPLVLPFKDYF
ncbi:MAG: NosD domain-containing protein, partial [Euryarchaeota archaeon]|nr:NosD domain-containing protein [Euryarchaeota archaeon]